MDLKTQGEIRKQAVYYFGKAGIFLTEEEKKNKIQIFEYRAGNFYTLGLIIVPFINTERYCGKFLFFFPGQSAAEHFHPDVEENRGKEETLRVLWGMAYAYGAGTPTKNIKAKIPEDKEQCFTSKREVILNPGDQFTVGYCEKHWWQAGPEGFVALEVSSTSRDLNDSYTDNTLDFNIY